MALQEARHLKQAASVAEPTVRNLEQVDAWGLADHCLSNVYRPTSVEEIRQVFEIARRRKLSIGLRGAGCSYGDASLNEDGMLLDFSKMDRILKWDPESGIVTGEPGVTLKKLWQSTIEDGYWPPVVSGTMFTTLGGVAAMNIHGKNNFKAGPIGNHILEFDFMLPDGTVKTCSREQNSELFYAAIGGFGMLGVFTSVTLKMKKVHSGYLWVEAIVAKNLRQMFEQFQERLPESDYLVGWIDCIKGGRALGRGVIHQANYLEAGADPDPKESLRVANQGLPDKIMGVFPSSLTYLLMQPYVNNRGMGLINAAKYWSARWSLRGHRHLQSHAAFAFLLDYVPNWKFAYKPGGLIQYQSFVPKETAEDTFRKLIQVSRAAGLPPYLGVFKRHQPDLFLMTHAVDGYSFALDYKVVPQKRQALWDLCHRLDEIVLKSGGRFYFAKDSTLTPSAVQRYMGEERLRQFKALKAQLDPNNTLQTNLSRRLFAFGG